MSGIKGVAREAGVSTATVSHVVNNTRFVSEEVRARVLGAVERCGYYPNAHARSLASGRSNTLGLVVSDISNPFFPELIKSIEAAAFERGYDLVLSNTDYDPGRTSHYVRRFIERKVAGVAVMTSELDKKLIGELASRNVSVVFLDLGRPCVRMSNLRVELRDRHRRSDPPPRRARPPRGRLRRRPRTPAFDGATRKAVRASMLQYLPGAEPRVLRGDFKLEGGRRAARELLAGGELPSALVAANDLMALGAMAELRAAGVGSRMTSRSWASTTSSWRRRPTRRSRPCDCRARSWAGAPWRR